MTISPRALNRFRPWLFDWHGGCYIRGDFNLRHV